MASDFSIQIQRWDVAVDGFTSTDGVPGEKYLMVEYPIPDAEGQRHVHAIPLSGIAYRMEILGIQDPQRVFDITLKEMNIPDRGDDINFYQEPVQKYYWAATEFAKELTADAGTMHLRSVPRRETPEEFIATVRNLLKGGPQLRTMNASITSVENVSTDLAQTRTSSITRLSNAASPVVIEDNGAAQDIKGFISESTKELDTMADFHAHRAMEPGAYYYANLLRGQ